MATQISVPGAHSVPPLIFTVSGVSTTNYALDFQTALQAASSAGSLTINVLSNGTAQSTKTGGTTLNEILSNTTVTSPYSLTQTGEYTLALVGSETTINGSTFGGDTVVAGGAVTFIESSFLAAAAGGHDNVDFIAGSNMFVGNAASGDTVTGGSGYDTISTGTGATTVFSGSGHTLINLNDTSTVAGSGGDIAFLGDGNATVNAYGLADTVVAAAPGQTIFAIGPATANDTIVIGSPDSPGGLAGGDTLVLGAASVSVFDSVGGNSIFGGAGALTFVGQTGSSTVSDSIVNGAGSTYIWGANNDDITFASTSGSGSLTVVAGVGNETLNGANAGSFNFFGPTDTTSAASNNTTIVGGSGSDYFSTGTGNETFVAGSGSDVFGLNTVAGGSADHITIYDFSAADSVSFNGASQSDVNTAVNTGTVTTDSNGTSDLTITLSDNSTVTFVNTTSLNGHIL